MGLDMTNENGFLNGLKCFIEETVRASLDAIWAALERHSKIDTETFESMGRDLFDIHKRLANLEMSHLAAGVEQRLKRVDERLSKIESTDGLDGKVEKLRGAVARVDNTLAKIEEKIDNYFPPKHEFNGPAPQNVPAKEKTHKSPGQVTREAFWKGNAKGWDCLTEEEQSDWERAAAAVIEQFCHD